MSRHGEIALEICAPTLASVKPLLRARPVGDYRSALQLFDERMANASELMVTLPFLVIAHQITKIAAPSSAATVCLFYQPGRDMSNLLVA